MGMGDRAWLPGPGGRSHAARTNRPPGRTPDPTEPLSFLVTGLSVTTCLAPKVESSRRGGLQTHLPSRL